MLTRHPPGHEIHGLRGGQGHAKEGLHRVNTNTPAVVHHLSHSIPVTLTVLPSQAEELAKRALGEDTVQEMAEAGEKALSMVDEKAIADMQASFNQMAEQEIPEEMKEKIAARTGKIWDDLSHDDKTRELAATLVKNMGAAAGDKRIVELQNQILKSVESKAAPTATACMRW